MSYSESSVLDNTKEEGGHPSEWLAKALRARPEILETYERIRPLSELNSFGTRVSCSTTETKHAISHSSVMNLILDFLDESGYQKTKENILQQGKMSWNKREAEANQLRKVMQMSVKDLSTVLDPSLTDLENASGVEGDAEVQMFDYRPIFKEEYIDNDIDLWDEGPLSNTNLVLSEEDAHKTISIISGTCNKIIEFITSASQGNLSTRTLVLATYRSWMTAETLFEKLMQRYNIPELAIQRYGGEDPVKFVKNTCTQVALVLKTWMMKHKKDFSEALIEQLQGFVENQLVKDGRNDLAKMLRSPLAKLVEVTNEGDEVIFVDVSKCPDPKVPKNIFSPLLKLDHVPKEEVARQLTLIDNKSFTGIEVIEFFSRNWCKSSNIRSSGVAAIINRFNHIVKWVISSILRAQRYKDRAAILLRFLEIAQHLKQIQSYNSMAAIYYGVTHGAIYRLSHSFNELSSDARKIITELKEFLDPNGGYRRYIATYESQRAPKIPFLGAHLQEISFIDETTPDMIGEMINLEKRSIIYEKVQSILKYQSIGFNFLPVRQVAVFLQKFDLIRDESEMYKLSEQREPKGISVTDLVEHEKET